MPWAFEPTKLADIAEAAQSLGLEDIAQTALDAAFLTANGLPVPYIGLLLADIREASREWPQRTALSPPQRVLLRTLDSR